MEIVKNYTFTAARGNGKYTKLLEEFLALDEGTVVKFTKDVDFDTDAKKFSLSLRTTLWGKGKRAKINVDGDDVYAAVVGTREPKQDQKVPVAEPVEPPVQAVAAVKTRKPRAPRTPKAQV